MKKEEDVEKTDKVYETAAVTTEEKEGEEETPKANKEAPQEVPEKMDTTVREEKDSTKISNDEES